VAQCVAKKFVNNHFIIGELFMRLLREEWKDAAAATALRQRTHSPRIFMCFGPDGVWGIRNATFINQNLLYSLFIQSYYIIAGALDATRTDRHERNQPFLRPPSGIINLYCVTIVLGALQRIS
jgi:hypothetical protein